MRSSVLLIFGIVLTIVFIIVCTWLGLSEICINNIDKESICKTNFQTFLDSPPNEKGDALAGIAGSLAFFWIIVTVLLQANELSLQRAELKQTRQALEKQTKFLENQDIDRQTIRIDEKIDAKIKLLLSKLPELAFDKFLLSRNNNKVTETKSVTFLTKHNFNADDPPEHYATAIMTTSKTLDTFINEGWEVITPTIPHSWWSCVNLAKEIRDEVSSGSDAKIEEITYGFKINNLWSVLNNTLNNKKYWGTPEVEKNS